MLQTRSAAKRKRETQHEAAADLAAGEVAPPSPHLLGQVVQAAEAMEVEHAEAARPVAAAAAEPAAAAVGRPIAGPAVAQGAAVPASSASCTMSRGLAAARPVLSTDRSTSAGVRPSASGQGTHEPGSKRAKLVGLPPLPSNSHHTASGNGRDAATGGQQQQQQQGTGSGSHPEEGAAGEPGAAPGTGQAKGTAGPAPLPPDLDVAATASALQQQAADLDEALRQEVLLDNPLGTETGRRDAMPASAEVGCCNGPMHCARGSML